MTIQQKIKALESELKILKKQYLEQKHNERASRILEIMKLLKKECEKKGFVLANFIKENKFNYEYMNAFYKIGLLESGGAPKKPTYKWNPDFGNPTILDAEFAIDKVNMWAKERRCL